jgi:hypothetical protein
VIEPTGFSSCSSSYWLFRYDLRTSKGNQSTVPEQVIPIASRILSCRRNIAGGSHCANQVNRTAVLWRNISCNSSGHRADFRQQSPVSKLN